MGKLDPMNGMCWTNFGLSLTKLSKNRRRRKNAAKQAVRLAPDFGASRKGSPRIHEQQFWRANGLSKFSSRPYVITEMLEKRPGVERLGMLAQQGMPMRHQ